MQRPISRLMLKPRPVRLVVLGYLVYIIAGSILLSLPWFHSRDALSGVDALFTATSALSTTGLTTVSTGRDYNLAGQIVVLILIQLGGIGYMTLGSFGVLSAGGVLSERRRQIGKVVFSMPQRFRIDKFIRSVIVFTFIIEGLGAIALYAALSRSGTPNRVWSSIFHMVVGASPSGTGGGLKSTTVSALFGVVRSVLRGRTQVLFWGRAMPEETVWVATASLCLYATSLVVGSYLLALTQTFPFEGLVFECASALGTVGLSTGITPQLTSMGKVIITALMLIGRVGPLSFAMAVFLPSKTAGLRPSEDLAI